MLQIIFIYLNKVIMILGRFNIDENEFVEASQDELLFIKHHMPLGMIPMVKARTGATRSKILYQLQSMPENQDKDIITALREILFVVTGVSYQDEIKKSQTGR